MLRISAGLIALTLGMGASALAAAPAGDAPGSPQAPSVRVRYDDLDLGRDAGVRVLYGRLRTAARRVCASLDRPGARAQQMWRACYADTLAAAVEKSGSDRLVALHYGKQPRIPLAAGSAVSR